MVARINLETEHRLKEQRATDGTGANVFENGHGSWFVLRPVRGHRGDIRLARGGDCHTTSWGENQEFGASGLTGH